MNKSTLYTFLFLIVLASCEVKPSEINYNSDSCHSCKMTIVDQQHAAQIVTNKGRSYKFDAIECMVQNLDNWKTEDLAFVLVTDYSNPKKLIAAAEANYLISLAIPSPMGEHLSAFSDERMRNNYVQSTSDQALNWEKLKSVIR